MQVDHLLHGVPLVWIADLGLLNEESVRREMRGAFWQRASVCTVRKCVRRSRRTADLIYHMYRIGALGSESFRR